MSITIEIGKVYSKISGDYPVSALRKELSYLPRGYQFMPRYRMKQWDGRIHLMSIGGKFPSGLYPTVRKFLISRNLKFQVKRVYRIPTVQDVMQPNNTKLRDYQLEAVRVALKKTRGVLKQPAGSGKTLVASSIIKTLNRPTVFLTHKKDLLYQTKRVFEEEIGKDKIGLIGDGIVETNQIDIVSIPTISRTPTKFKSYFKRKEVLIADEVHHAQSNTWYKTIMQIPAMYRFGLTATPQSGDKFLLLEACTGKVIYTTEYGELIKDKYLSKPKVLLLKVTKPDIPDRQEYQTAYRDGIVQNKWRNRIIAGIAKKLCSLRLDPVCIITKFIEHGSNIEKEVSSVGLEDYRFIHGQHSAQERMEVIQNVLTGKVKVLITSPIFGEGVDIPPLRSMILASGGYSYIKVIQEAGRGMRSTESKSEVLIIDFFDDTHSYLLKHSKRRRNIYKSELLSKVTPPVYNSLDLLFENLY
ncbi:MAG: DEAD/DEAH box helicase [Planctomycetes bacterium]|nr:DEAD/DEAH box helicase [Planctomycetota bacterium]